MFYRFLEKTRFFTGENFRLSRLYSARRRLGFRSLLETSRNRIWCFPFHYLRWHHGCVCASLCRLTRNCTNATLDGTQYTLSDLILYSKFQFFGKSIFTGQRQIWIVYIKVPVFGKSFFTVQRQIWGVPPPSGDVRARPLGPLGLVL